MAQKEPLRVAIVGSGLAGLATAYLLRQDASARYEVTLFEEGNVLSLDSASVSVPVTAHGGGGDQSRSADRIDLPMRSFSPAYYANLTAMFKHLGARYEAQPFVYDFCRNVAVAGAGAGAGASARSPASWPLASMTWTPYFAYASNLHRVPPERPKGLRLFAWLAETLYVVACYAWFCACCCFVQPRPRPDHEGGQGERLDDYLRRIRLPRYFVTYYVLPVLSSIATCSHQELLHFPAVDVTEYNRLLWGQQHQRLSNGVQDVQDKLARGINTRLLARVTAVEPLSSGEVRIRWTQRGDADVNGQGVDKEEPFDRVILAVTPNVVGRIFRPLEHAMARIPTVAVESTVHADGGVAKQAPVSAAVAGRRHRDSAAQTIHFRTALVNGQRRTEAVHIQPSGAMVTTCPLSCIRPAQVIKSATFTRVLRTPESRRITNRIFGDSSPSKPNANNPLGQDVDAKAGPRWRNGDAGVWLVGGWCWDGMVLLEGCVVSAMRVADAFDVHIPWRGQ